VSRSSDKQQTAPRSLHPQPFDPGVGFLVRPGCADEVGLAATDDQGTECEVGVRYTTRPRDHPGDDVHRRAAQAGCRAAIVSARDFDAVDALLAGDTAGTVFEAAA